ncbi:hypothetical protein [uncultured Friedmanniella sp.]|uniref:hypothetical protein n=1 Tax=uncultured Friedmanniella sp. TaxID=335381 RepID=UPI0035C985A3
MVLHHPRSPLARNPLTRNPRSILRWTHLVVGSLLATYVYLPVGSADWLRWTLMLVGIPTVSVTGVWMWKQALVRRWFARRRGARSATSVPAGS